MTITEPCEVPQPKEKLSAKEPTKSGTSSHYESTTGMNNKRLDSTPAVSESAIDMLAHLFPHRKRSVLELILRRCDLDLLKAIEQCSPSMSAFKPIAQAQLPVRTIYPFYSPCSPRIAIDLSLSHRCKLKD